MADVDDDRDEEWFKEVYGREYTGPSRPSRDNARLDSSNLKKRSGVNSAATCDGHGSDEEGEPRDPNAVPTDFTSREAKVWEAKAKAVERNWKRRKEEELTCRICGEVGHFAQGCPTTLGGNRKQGEVVERISFRDKRLKPRLIGTGGAVIQGIEKDTGCRLKLEDNLVGGPGSFCVRISGSDRVNVGKAADVVNKLVEQVEDERKQPELRRVHGGGSIGSDNSRGTTGGSDGDRRVGECCESFRGSNINPLIAAQMQHIAVQRLQHSAPNFGPPARGEARPLSLDEDKRTIEHIASQLEARRQWEATSGSQAANGSPPYPYKEGRAVFGAGSLPTLGRKMGGSEARHYQDGNQDDGPYQSQCTTGSLSELEQRRNLALDEILSAQTLDELENRFLQETIELTKDQNAEEDEENMKHRERMKDIQEHYQVEMTVLRSKHNKQREEFLCHKARLRQQQYQHGGGYGIYQCSGGGSVAPSCGVSYNGSYDCNSHAAIADNLHGHGRLGVFESFQDAGPIYGSRVSHAYGKKQGYDPSKSYVTQVYNSSPHVYGHSPTY